MIASIRDRATFRALTERGTRHVADGLVLRVLVGDATPSLGAPRGSARHHGVRVAFAIRRSVGNAVVRNQLRRRLRAQLDQRADRLVEGAYLFIADPTLAGVDSAGLGRRIDTLMDDLARTRSASS